MAQYGVPGSGIFSNDGSVSLPPVPLQQPQNLYRFGEQTIWSTQFLVGGAGVANQTFRLFATPQGQNGQGFAPMSIGETNLKEGGRIPSGVAYDVFGIACHVSAGLATGGVPTSLAVPMDTDGLIGDLLNIQTNAVLTWDFTQTQVDIAPINLVGAGGGAYGALATAANAAQIGHMNNGAGAVWMYRKYPVALPGNSTFSILLRFGTMALAIAGSTGANTSGVAVKIVLLGYYKNIVEIG